MKKPEEERVNYVSQHSRPSLSMSIEDEDETYPEEVYNVALMGFMRSLMGLIEKRFRTSHMSFLMCPMRVLMGLTRVSMCPP